MCKRNESKNKIFLEVKLGKIIIFYYYTVTYEVKKLKEKIII